MADDVRLGSLDGALAALHDRKVPAWDAGRHYSGEPERTRPYIFVVDTINFSFWGGKGGYWRLAEGLRDAFAGESRLWEPAVLEAITPEQLSTYVGELPLMHERAGALHELGRLVREIGRRARHGFSPRASTASATWRPTKVSTCPF
jgi:hypothetical protein